MKSRFLNANEISCRVQMISEKGLNLLLYVTSRAGQTLLDELYGDLYWQDKYEVIDGDLLCTISVYNSELQQWISRSDVGKAKQGEEEKSRASDSFKRACVKFGIARELYSAPFIWISSNDCKIYEEKGKYKTRDTFKVTSIKYSKNGEIIGLEIINNRTGSIVYKLFADEKIDEVKIKTLNILMEKADVQLKSILDFCKIKKIEDMKTSSFVTVCNKLQNTITAKESQP